MKKILTLSAALTLGALMLTGCPKAQEAANAGADAAANAGGKMADAGNKMSGAAADAGNKMAGAADAAKDKMGAAVDGMLDKGKLAAAITGEPDLKDAKIEIEIKDKTVFLKGKVKNNDLKKKAGDVVSKIAMGATVKNMLLVGE
jgi:osmotically-inducible protein OsmY